MFQIIFPGVTKYSFHKLLCYLYTDEIPQISTDKCLNLLEVANRLCLPRLINLIECRVIEDLTNISQSDTIEAVKNCLDLLEPVKVRSTLGYYFYFPNELYCLLFFQSYTMHISWPNGVCHIYVSIII